MTAHIILKAEDLKKNYFYLHDFFTNLYQFDPIILNNFFYNSHKSFMVIQLNHL